MNKFRALLSHPILRNSAVMFVGSMMANVMAFLYHLVIGRILGKEQYSELAAIFALFYILNVPAPVLQTILVKFFSQFKAENANGKARHLFFAFTKVLLALCVAGGAIAVIGSPLITKFLNLNSPWYVYWLYIIFIFTLVSTINASILLSYQRFFALALIIACAAVLRLVLGVAFAPGGVGLTLFSAVIAAGAGYAFLFFPLRFIFRYKTQSHSISKWAAFKYSVPTLLTLLGLTALFTQDVLLVKHYFSAADSGIYSAVSVLGKIIFFASSSIALVAFPTLVERKTLKKSYSSIVLLSLGAVAGISSIITVVYFVAPQIVVLVLFGNSYIQARQYLGLFGIFISFYSLVNLLINIFLALGKTRIWILTCLASAAQMIGITIYHRDLVSVISVNLGVTIALFAVLLLYYRYGEQKA